MPTDCESVITNMPVLQSFEVMSGLFNIRRVRALVTNANTFRSVRLGIHAAGK